jgi:hypothetical protein
MTKFGPFGRYLELIELTYNFPYSYFVQFALYMFSKFIEDPDLIVSELLNTADTSKHRDLADLTVNVQFSLCTRHEGICGN